MPDWILLFLPVDQSVTPTVFMEKLMQSAMMANHVMELRYSSNTSVGQASCVRRPIQFQVIERKRIEFTSLACKQFCW